MERRVQPELLDELPGDDPRAIASRRDLRRINAWMGNARFMARGLRQLARRAAPRRIVDLGAGDGAFLLRWVGRLPALPRGIEVLFVDRSDATDADVMTALHARGFRPRSVRAEAGDWLRAQPVEAGTWVLTNLFLHHFTAESLRTLLGLVAEKAELCCACEPHRAWFPLAASRLLWLGGANAVTSHDAVVSVRAGFQRGELSALWPVGAGWRVHERRVGLFSLLFLAQRT